MKIHIFHKWRLVSREMGLIHSISIYRCEKCGEQKEELD